MKLEFEKPLVPNFIATKQGKFAIHNLSEDEIDEYAQIWFKTLKENYKKKKKVRNK